MTDIRIENHGTIFLFVPLTQEGKDWLENYLQTESWQWFGPNLAIDHGYAAGIAQLAREEGLTLA